MGTPEGGATSIFSAGGAYAQVIAQENVKRFEMRLAGECDPCPRRLLGRLAESERRNLLTMVQTANLPPRVRD